MRANRRGRSTLGERVRAGAGVGAACGAALALWAAVVGALTDGRVFERLEVSLPVITGAYVVGGASAGALFAVLRPLATGKFSAYAVGYLAGVAAVFPIMLPIMGDPQRWSLGYIVVGAIVAIAPAKAIAEVFILEN